MKTTCSFFLSNTHGIECWLLEPHNTPPCVLICAPMTTMCSVDPYFTVLILVCYLTDTPTIIAQVMDDTENEGDTASFTCQATGEPDPTISWYFNDVPVDVTNTTKYTVSVTSLNVTTSSSTLSIMSVQSSDVGTYTCNATNVVSSDTSSGVLTVNGEDYFIT